MKKKHVAFVFDVLCLVFMAGCIVVSLLLLFSGCVDSGCIERYVCVEYDKKKAAEFTAKCAGGNMEGSVHVVHHCFDRGVDLFCTQQGWVHTYSRSEYNIMRMHYSGEEKPTPGRCPVD